MFRFNFSPSEFYPALGNLSRPNPVAEPVDMASTLGQAVKRVADAVGSNVQASIMYFPANYAGQFKLDQKPNPHVFQLLGSCKAGDRLTVAGDMAGLDSCEIEVSPSVYAPCVLAYMGFDTVVKSTRNVKLAPDADELIKQILIADSVAPEVCSRIIESLEASEGEYGRVLADPYSNKTEVRLQHRKARMMNSTDPKFVKGVLRDIIVAQVEPFFSTTIEYWQAPVLLKYDTGGFFNAHVDGENYRDGVWSRIYDRDYTLVCFLNSDYEGGRLFFPDLDFAVEPKIGRVAAFPATHRFLHGAEKIASGTRYQLVSWLTEYGTPRTNTPPVANKIYRTW